MRLQPHPPRGFRLGVDIGGTFTDVVLLGDDGSVRTKKVLSTPDDYARGVVGGAVALLAECDVAAADVAGVVHASTVASNTILEGLGARTALITTEGFRDVLEMRRLRIPVLYDIQYEGPTPLVPRRLRFEVPERLGPRGEVWRELDEERVEAVAREIAAAGVEAVAIALIHAYANDAHERRVEEIVREIVDQAVYVTRSSEILPEIREYERTSTAVVNAYVGPAITHYVAALAAQLRGAGITAPLDVIQSAGGTLTPEIARRKPAHLVESGPAAGVMACAYLGRLTGQPQLISLDMGGTTAKAAIVEDGLPVRTSEYEVGAGINLSSKLVKGGGHPIKLPFIDVSEIGAGGGSIVSVDPLGTVRVGPVSAGASPGPACYDLGGLDPTLTDALLALGYLNESQLGGGAITLSPAAGRDALDREVATSARPLRRGGVARDPDARRRHHDSRRQSGDDLPWPRPARLHAVRLRRERPAHRGRDRARPADPARADSSGARSVQRTRPSLLRHRARGGAHADVAGREVTAAALERAFAVIEPEAAANLVATDDARSPSPARGRPVRGAGLRAARAHPAGPDRSGCARLRLRRRARQTYGHGSADDPVDVVSVRALARIERTTARRYDPLATIRALAQLGACGQRTSAPTPGASRLLCATGPGFSRASAAGPLLIDEADSTCVVPPAASPASTPSATSR